MYIARFTDNQEQGVKEHIKKVAVFCACFARYIGLENIAKLCGYLHDMGKYSKEYQDYIKEAKEHTRNNTYDQWKKTAKTIDHGIYGAKFIYGLYEGNDKYAKLVRDIVAESVAYHHGGLPDNLAEDNTVPLITRMKKVDDNEFERVIKTFYEENPEFDFKELFENSKEEIKKIMSKISNPLFDIGLLTKNIYSYLVDADRLDAYLFETSKDFEAKDNKDLWKTYSKNLEEELQNISNKVSRNTAEGTVNSIREDISKQCLDFSKKGTGIYTLTVPTGGGKTLSSLRFALNHSIANEKQRIFYIIPYTSIIEQNAAVARSVLRCGENLLEYHSNVTNDAEDSDLKVISERFSSPIVFTTMVQFLNCFYDDGNGNIRRMHNFENAVIIFDEIQTLPLKCTKLFFNLINYFKNVCNTTSVLCTATQPNFDYIKEKLKITFDGEIIENVEQLYNDLKRMEVIDYTENPMDFLELSDFVCNLKEENKSILVVLNKVDSAETLFELVKPKIKEDTKLNVLTSRMCPKHRSKAIEDLKNSLDAEENVICISTQIVEAGIDISFSAVVRSLCGLDSIAQASGRGNRNGEKAVGNTYIVDICKESVSMLDEIAHGQKHTKDLLSLYKRNEEKYNYSLLSPKAINEYYRHFYSDEEINKKFDYPLKDPVKNSILDLLTQQKKRTLITANNPLSFNYQFKTARKEFMVIDNKTYTIIVPYDKEAKDAIGIILSKASLGEKYDALKQLQKYTVNIYKNLFDELVSEDAFTPNEIEGVYLLSDMYYNKTKGVTTEKNMEEEIF